jgi:hypothetical protein
VSEFTRHQFSRRGCSVVDEVSRPHKHTQTTTNPTE